MNASPIDRHGYIDITVDGIEDSVRFDQSKDTPILSGSTINAVLYNSFILCGYDNENKDNIYGGNLCWEEILEAMFVTLTYHLTVYELISRIRVICEKYITGRREYSDKMTMSEELTINSNLLYGSMVFMHIWVAHFHDYLTETELTLVRRGIVCLGNLGLRDVSGRKSIDACGEMYRRVEVLIDIVTKERSLLTTGVRSNLSYNVDYNPLTYLSSYDVKLYDFIYKDKVYLSSSGPYRFIYHSRSYTNHMPIMTNPGLNVLSGTWDRDSKVWKENLSALSASPKFKIDIFGGNNLFDDSDDDEDGDNGVQISSGNVDAKPIPRILVGTSLLESPFSMLIEQSQIKEIWSYDIDELARQLTLIDHSIFCAIPLNCLVRTSWSEPRHTLSAPDYKRLADRFNSLSLWATTSVLREDDVKARAMRYGQIVRLTSRLVDLDNFSSAIALLSALRQSSISRLAITLQHVDSKDKELFNTLKKRLSDDKNYLAYRQEVKRKSQMVLMNTKEWTSLRDGIDVRASIFPHTPTDNACVPYLGIFSGDLAAIHEGNSDYLPEAPHLINIDKFVLITKTVQTIRRFQQLSYNFEPIRNLAAAWNQLLKPYSKLTTAQAEVAGERLFNRSLGLETPEMISKMNSQGIHENEEGNENTEEEIEEFHRPPLKKEKSTLNKIYKSLKKTFSTKKGPKVADEEEH